MQTGFLPWLRAGLRDGVWLMCTAQGSPRLVSSAGLLSVHPFPCFVRRRQLHLPWSNLSSKLRLRGRRGLSGWVE